MDQKKMLDTNLLSRFAKNAYRRMHAGDNATLAAAKSYADAKAATGAGGSEMLRFKEVVTDVRTLKSWGYGFYGHGYKEDFFGITFYGIHWDDEENLLMQNINKNNFLIYENVFTPTNEAVIFYTYSDLIPDMAGGRPGLCRMKIILFNGRKESGDLEGYLDWVNFEKPRGREKAFAVVNGMPTGSYDIMFLARRFFARAADGTIYNRWPGCEKYNVYTTHTSTHPETNEEISIESALARTDATFYNESTRQILVADESYTLLEIPTLEPSGHLPSDKNAPEAFNMLHFAGRDEVVTPAHVSTVNTIAINACNERVPGEYTFSIIPADEEAIPPYNYIVILPTVEASLGGPLEGLIVKPNTSGGIRVLPYNNTCNPNVWGNPAIPVNSEFVHVSQDYPEGEYSIVYFCNRFFAKDSSGVLHNRWAECERFNTYTVRELMDPDTGEPADPYIGKARSEVVFVDDSNGRTYRANADGELVQFAFLNSDGKLPMSVIPQSLQCVQHYNGDASGSVVNQMPTGDFTVVYSTSYRRFFAKTANSLHRTWSTSNLFNNGEHPRTDTLFINDATGRILVADADGNLIELASLSTMTTAITENAASIESLREAMYTNDSTTLAFGENGSLSGIKIGPNPEIEGGYGIIGDEYGMTFHVELEPGESVYLYARSYSTENDALNAHFEEGACTGEVVPLSEIPDFAVLSGSSNETLQYKTADDLAENNCITNNTDETIVVYCSMVVPSEDNWPEYLALPQMLKHELKISSVESLVDKLKRGEVIAIDNCKLSCMSGGSFYPDLRFDHAAVIALPPSELSGVEHLSSLYVSHATGPGTTLWPKCDSVIDFDTTDIIELSSSGKFLICEYNLSQGYSNAILMAVTSLFAAFYPVYIKMNTLTSDLAALTKRVAALEAASTATTATAQSDESVG